jgi:hypothetical protein
MIKGREKASMAGKRAVTLAIGAATTVVALSTIAPAAQAAAQTTPKTAVSSSQVPAACRIAAQTSVRGSDDLRLWKCDGTGGTRVGYHGEFLSGRKGDQLYLQSASGLDYVQVNIPGSGTYNTATVGDNGGPWAACVRVPNGGEHCTSHAW